MTRSIELAIGMPDPAESVEREARSVGRRPTLGELLHYYSRDDIASILYYQSRRWKLLLQFRYGSLFEPTDERNAREILLRQLKDLARDAPENAPLDRYPTMHLLKDRGEREGIRRDFMTEDDPPSWKRAFLQMEKALDVLDSLGAFYRIKFSGHRSLHLWIPAEAFPATFRGKPLDDQFPAIEKRIKAYLPPTGHCTLGFRAVYSTHPIGAMVSVPLTREELPNFRPWMANIHTVAVDDAWFRIPDDAIERNERFLHAIFEEGERFPVSVPPRDYRSAPVRAYAPDPPLPEETIRAGLESPNSIARAEAARAALIQKTDLPADQVSGLLLDDDRDVRWFAAEIAFKRPYLAEIEAVVGLIAEGDDYLVGLGHDLLSTRPDPAGELRDYLLGRETVDPPASAAFRTLAALDWPRLAEMPRHLGSSSYQDRLRAARVICGAALSLDWNFDIEAIYSASAEALRNSDGSEAEIADGLRQLDALRALRPEGSHKSIQDAPLFEAAEALRERGVDLKGIVFGMLASPHIGAMKAAIRLLVFGGWPDGYERLIDLLGAGNARRKAAARALSDIGKPAMEALVARVHSSRNPHVLRKCLHVLGEIGDPALIPSLNEWAKSPNPDLRKTASRVLFVHFGVLPDGASEESPSADPDDEAEAFIEREEAEEPPEDRGS